jgi:hypothetical protein
MKSLLLGVCLAAASVSFAQQVVDVTSTAANSRIGQNALYSVAGQPFVNVKFVKLTEGSPYFKDQFHKAIAVGDNGYEFKDLSLKLDLYDKQILYLENGKEYLATTKVKELIITDSLGWNYKFVRFDIPSKSGNASSTEWYQWLTSGKASLYKEYRKKILETKPYGSPTTEQKIITRENYLIYFNNVFLEAKKLKDVPGILADKKAQLEEFLKNKDDKQASMDDRFKALVDYYNTL